MIIWLTRRASVKLILYIATSTVLFTSLVVYKFHAHGTDDEQQARNSLANQLIVLDAGHGGIDGGAESRAGTLEKDLNLVICYLLRDYLHQAGAHVYMIREQDVDLATDETKRKYGGKRKTADLIRRAELAQQQKADIFISVHMNSIPSPRWRGAQTFYYPNLEQNATLAKAIQSEMRRTLENTTREAALKRDNFLLKTIDATPAVLVEVGFLSHPEEAEQLSQSSYQRKVAASIYMGILRFLGTAD